MCDVYWVAYFSKIDDLEKKKITNGLNMSLPLQAGVQNNVHRVKTRGNLTVIRSVEHKALSVGLLETKVYCYYLFTVFSESYKVQEMRQLIW